MMEEALKEIIRAKFKKAQEAEFKLNVDLEREIEIVKLKIDLHLDEKKIDTDKVKELSEYLEKLKSRLALKCSYN